jgi:K+-transporting ATPase ATPase A chain
MARVFEGERTFLHPVLRWIEVLTYKAAGIREEVEQRWTHYTAALLSFSIFGFLIVYFLQRAQAYLPLNPQNFKTPVMPPDLAFNTAVSFMTNTNWQAYSGEVTMSYFVQMAGLAVQNFASAAAGMAAAVAVVRGFARQEKKTIGNFWVDVTRATVYILLPLCIVVGLILCSQGVIQNLNRILTPPQLKAPHSPSRRAQLHRRKRSSSLAATAAASSTRTPGTPSRILHRCRTCSRCF